MNQPLFKTRAFQLDLGRQPEKLPTLKRMLSFASRFGYNQCHLYLENSLRLDSFGPAARGLAKTKMAELIDFAADLDMEIVPSLNLLGHTEHFLAYDEFKDMDEVRDGPRQPWQNMHNCMCPSLDKTRQWAANVIAEVAELFPSPDLHVGLDETWTLGSCRLCREREASIGLGGIYAEYASTLNDMVKAHNRRMWMWADMCLYYDNVLESLPRDIVLVDWNYGRIAERPLVSFRNWRAVDTVRDFIAAGFTVVPAGIDGVENIRSFTRYVAGLGLDTFLVTNWEGAMRYPDNILPSLCRAGNLLTTGSLPAWSDMGKQLLPEYPETEQRDYILADTAGTAELEPAANVLRSLPDSLLHRVTLSARLLSFARSELGDLKNEIAMAARGVLRDSSDAVAVMAPLMIRLGKASEAVAELLDLLEWLAGFYEEERNERGIYKNAQTLADRLKSLRKAVDEFCAAPSAGTFPGEPIELVFDLVVVDPCAHACRVEIAGEDEQFETIYDVSALPVGGKVALRAHIIPLKRVPKLLRLSFNGYARLGVSGVRCRTVDEDILPVAVRKVSGEVRDAEHLLEWNRKAAFFNEPDVDKKWRHYGATSDNHVVLEF